MKHPTLVLLPPVALLFVGALCLPLRAQDVTAIPEAPPLATHETYRLRVENGDLGRVEVSADDGAHYVLIGRVRRAATAYRADRSAPTPGLVVRSGDAGLTFAVAANRVLTLRPVALPSPASRSGSEKAKERAGKTGKKAKKYVAPTDFSGPSFLTTSLRAGRGILGDLLPPLGTHVRLQNGLGGLMSFPEGYSSSETDVFVFQVTLTPAQLTALPPSSLQQAGSPDGGASGRDAIGPRLAALAADYQAESLLRARRERRAIVSGLLTLNARLPENEPDPIALVTYRIDGDVVNAQNVGPFRYEWDTRQADEGEHLIEIRALSRAGALITRARELVFVRNRTASLPAKRPFDRRTVFCYDGGHACTRLFASAGAQSNSAGHRF